MDNKSTDKPTKRSGRSARLAKRNKSVGTVFPSIIRRIIPTYELLSEETLEKIEAQADWILKEIGIEFRGDEEALQLFKEAGADIQGERVRFENGLAKFLCSTAPSSFKMHARHSEKSIVLGGDHIVLMPSYGPPFVHDLDNGRRYATLEDFENIVKLTYQSPWLNHSGGTVREPVDIPVNKRHLDMVYAHLRYSAKPFMGSVTSPERAADSIAMEENAF